MNQGCQGEPHPDLPEEQDLVSFRATDVDHAGLKVGPPSVLANHSPFGGVVSQHFQLLMDFDHVWRAISARPGAWRKIECYLACRPDVHLTFVTSRHLGEALAELTERGDLLPDSWICEGGLTLQRLQPDGTYEADRAFERGLELLSHESLGQGGGEAVQPSLTALYLGAKGWAPRPRFVVGDPKWNHDLLRIADRAIRVNSHQRNLEAAVLAEIRGALELSSDRSRALPLETSWRTRPAVANTAHALPM